LAQAKGFAVELQQLALILVDIQRDFWQPLKGIPQAQAFPANVAALLRSARAHGLTIIHTQAVFQPDRSDWMLFYRSQGRGQVPCMAGSAGAQFEAFAAPLRDESVTPKQTFDGFANTDLERRLRERGVKTVLIAGLETSVCVLFTATSAYLRRFVPLVVADACADEPERHEATLRMYDRLCFQTVTTAQAQGDYAEVLRVAEPFAD
jgi:ureidoacrylate peracid hydrolase